MRKSITHLEVLFETGYIPASTEDEKEIERCLKNEIEIYFEDDLKVYNEGGIYIADLKTV